MICWPAVCFVNCDLFLIRVADCQSGDVLPARKLSRPSPDVMSRILGNTAQDPGAKEKVSLLAKVVGTGHWTSYRHRIFFCNTKNYGNFASLLLFLGIISYSASSRISIRHRFWIVPTSTPFESRSWSLLHLSGIVSHCDDGEENRNTDNPLGYKMKKKNMHLPIAIGCCNCFKNKIVVPSINC